MEDGTDFEEYPIKPKEKFITDLTFRVADNGDFVIAKINSDNKAVFKQLVSDGSRYYLKSLNQQYPTITDEFEVIGRLISSIKEL